MVEYLFRRGKLGKEEGGRDRRGAKGSTRQGRGAE